MNGNYILAPGEPWNPIPCDDLREWGAWFEKSAERVVARTDFGAFGDVSTVFLATDHNFGFPGGPVLWETLVFGGPYDDEQRRDQSWCRAVARHSLWCRRVARVRDAFIAEYGAADAAEAAWRLDGNVWKGA